MRLSTSSVAVKEYKVADVVDNQMCFVMGRCVSLWDGGPVVEDLAFDR